MLGGCVGVKGSGGPLLAALGVPVGLVLLVVIVMGGGGSVPPMKCGQGSSGGAAPGGVGPLNKAGVPKKYAGLVAKAGKRCRAFPAPVIAAQIQQESGWDPHASSSAGAQGLSQFMPGTWSTWGHGSPSDPAAALSAQARYDCSLAKQVSGWKQSGQVHGNVTELALGAYNAGAGAVRAAGGVPQNAQTQAYVPKIMKSARGKFSQAGKSGGSSPAGGEGDAAGGGVQQASCQGGGGGGGASVPAVGKAKTVVATAQRYKGLPYVWGGGGYSGPTGGGFDCSGLVMASFHRAGVDLPRPARAQYQHTKSKRIKGGFQKSRYRPGDLLFYGSSASAIHHVAIVAGGGKLLQAPEQGVPVEKKPIYKGDFFAATRPLSQGGGK